MRLCRFKTVTAEFVVVSRDLADFPSYWKREEIVRVNEALTPAQRRDGGPYADPICLVFRSRCEKPEDQNLAAFPRQRSGERRGERAAAIGGS